MAQECRPGFYERYRCGDLWLPRPCCLPICSKRTRFGKDARVWDTSVVHTVRTSPWACDYSAAHSLENIREMEITPRGCFDRAAPGGDSVRVARYWAPFRRCGVGRIICRHGSWRSCLRDPRRHGLDSVLGSRSTHCIDSNCALRAGYQSDSAHPPTFYASGILSHRGRLPKEARSRLLRLVRTIPWRPCHCYGVGLRVLHLFYWSIRCDNSRPRRFVDAGPFQRALL